MVAVELSREQWLALRANSIGASESAAACGEARHCSALRLWAEKLGRQEREFVSTFATRRGIALEAFALEEYEHATGNRLLPTSTPAERERVEQRLEARGACKVEGWLHEKGRWQPFVRSVKWPWMTATLDGLAERPDGTLEVVEAKTVGMRAALDWGADESGMAPTVYRFQVLHTIAVTDADSACLAAVIGMDALRMVVETAHAPTIPIASIVALEGSFARCVRGGVEPDWDSAAAGDARKVRAALHPNDSGRTIILPPTVMEVHAEMQAWRAERLKLERAAKAIKEREEQAATRIEALLDGATYGTLPDGSGEYTRKTVSRAGYTVQPTTYPQLTFKESK